MYQLRDTVGSKTKFSELKLQKMLCRYDAENFDLESEKLRKISIFTA